MLLLDNIVFELQKAGGISLVWRSILESCMKDVELPFAILDSGLGGGNIFYPEFTESVNRVPDHGRLLFRRYSDIKKSIKCRLFHSSYFRVHASKKVKNIVTIHDFVYEKFDTGPRKVIHLWQKKHALSRADLIICVSENTKMDLLDYHPWLSERDIRVVYNGRGKDFFPLRDASENEIVTSFRKPFLLYVGGRHAHKNFIAALALLKTPEAIGMDLQLIVVGGGVFSGDELILINKLGLKEKVYYAGFVPNVNLNILYNNAFAFIYPSFYEGFGIPPLEAMAAGCPVICSNVSSIPEVVGDAGLLFDPHRPESAEEYILFLQDNDNRQQIVQRGLRRASLFSWDRTGGETVKIYKEIMP